MLEQKSQTDPSVIDPTTIDPNSGAWRIVFVVTDYQTKDGTTVYSYLG